jgi:aromatic amino acid transport protein AroP
MEFWFAIIKVVAVVAMILFGGWLLFSGNGGPQATVRNLWDQGGFLPHGFTGLVMMMAIIMFSFGGLELVGSPPLKRITRSRASESHQPGYLPYPDLLCGLAGRAAFTAAVDARDRGYQPVRADLPRAGRYLCGALNVVVLTAALSVYNSCVYCNSRMLFGLAQQGTRRKRC